MPRSECVLGLGTREIGQSEHLQGIDPVLSVRFVLSRLVTVPSKESVYKYPLLQANFREYYFPSPTSHCPQETARSAYSDARCHLREGPRHWSKRLHRRLGR